MPKLSLKEQQELLNAISQTKPWKLYSDPNDIAWKLSGKELKKPELRGVTKEVDLKLFLENGIRQASCIADKRKVEYCRDTHKLGCKCWRRVFMSIEERVKAIRKLLPIGSQWKRAFFLDKDIPVTVKDVYVYPIDKQQIHISFTKTGKNTLYYHVIYDSLGSFFVRAEHLHSEPDDPVCYKPVPFSSQSVVYYYDLKKQRYPEKAEQRHYKFQYDTKEDKVQNIEEVTRIPKVSETETDSTCRVCWEVESDCVFIACGHICCCVECAKKLDKCPICRTVGNFTKIFKS